MKEFFREIKLTDKADDLHADPLLRHIMENKEKLFYNIKSYAKSNVNNGVFPENIVRIVFNGINLNHLYKNHPHVDIGITEYGIEGVTEKNEIISIKSSIREGATTSSILSDSKSVKIDSLFSYIMYAYYNFNQNYKLQFSPSKLLKDSIEFAMEADEKFDSFMDLMTIVTYHCMFNNNTKGEQYVKDDTIRYIQDEDLEFGSISEYKHKVDNKINKLNAPISIGICYIDNKSKEGVYEGGYQCVIKKTNTILLYDYWYEVLSLWDEKGYFGAKNSKGKYVVKYLRFADIQKVFGIDKLKDFPIEIRIDTDDFKYSSDFSKMTDDEKEEHTKKMTDLRTRRVHLATKLKDANFGKKDPKIVAFLKATIDSLVDNPNQVKRFNAFLPRNKRVNLKRYKDL